MSSQVQSQKKPTSFPHLSRTPRSRRSSAQRELQRLSVRVKKMKSSKFSLKCCHLVKSHVLCVRLIQSSSKSIEDFKFSPSSSEGMITDLLDQLLEESLSLASLHEVCRLPAAAVQLISSQETGSTISTPEDLPRLKARPAQPSKSLPSPAPADAQLAKRSLFDSPAPSSGPPAADGPAAFSRAGFSNYRSVTPLADVDTPVKVFSVTPKSLKSAMLHDADTPGKGLSDTPRSVRFSDKSPERISPKPFLEATATATDVEFLLMKVGHACFLFPQSMIFN